MALDKWLDVDRRDQYWPEPKLTNADIELAIIKLFIIDIAHLIELKTTLSKNFRLQPSEIDKMTYWEYEFFIKYFNEQVKEENDRQKAEMDKYHVSEHMDMARPGNMKKFMANAQPKTPAMPNFGSMQAPSFKF